MPALPRAFPGHSSPLLPPLTAQTFSLPSNVTICTCSALFCIFFFAWRARAPYLILFTAGLPPVKYAPIRDKHDTPCRLALMFYVPYRLGYLQGRSCSRGLTGVTTKGNPLWRIGARATIQCFCVTQAATNARVNFCHRG